MGFDLNSTKDLSDVIVELCPPDGAHKHEQLFEEEELKNWSHREEALIVGIWVKSGDNHDPEDPAPPFPFDNPGAGEFFANEGVDCPPPPPEPECVGPTNVTADALSNGDILVGWDGVNGTEDGYNVYRHDGDGNFSLLANVNNTTTEYLDNETVAGVTYNYTVTATFGDQESNGCDEDSATALAPPPPPPPACVGPSNLTALAMPDGDIFVDWDGVNGEDGYNVYRHDGDGNFSLHAHVDAPTTEFLDNDTVIGNTYTYTVTATTGGQESDACEEASATAIPVFPSLVAASMAVLASLGAYGFVRRRN